jgi:hypothetical protein
LKIGVKLSNREPNCVQFLLYPEGNHKLIAKNNSLEA